MKLDLCRTLKTLYPLSHDVPHYMLCLLAELDAQDHSLATGEEIDVLCAMTRLNNQLHRHHP